MTPMKEASLPALSARPARGLLHRCLGTAPTTFLAGPATVYLSIAVVLIVVLPVVVSLPVGVLKMTPVPIGVANPPTSTTINYVLAVFRLSPTSVPVVVAGYPHAMIAVRVTALVGMSKRH